MTKSLKKNWIRAESFIHRNKYSVFCRALGSNRFLPSWGAQLSEGYKKVNKMTIPKPFDSSQEARGELPNPDLGVGIWEGLLGSQSRTKQLKLFILGKPRDCSRTSPPKSKLSELRHLTVVLKRFSMWLISCISIYY